MHSVLLWRVLFSFAVLTRFDLYHPKLLAVVVLAVLFLYSVFRLCLKREVLVLPCVSSEVFYFPTIAGLSLLLLPVILFLLQSLRILFLFARKARLFVLRDAGSLLACA